MSKAKHRNFFKLKADYYDDMLKGFNEYRTAAYSTGLDLLMWLSDFSIFSIMGSYDLWIVLNDYYGAQKKYQQYFYLRQASLICFELLTDISQHCNNNFNDLLINLIVDRSINNESRRIRKSLNKVRNDNVSKFKHIRNLTIAHRDHNISQQVEIMNNIDADWIIEFSLNYLKLIEELHILLNRAMNFISSDITKLGKAKFRKKYKKYELQ
jgi:hypothetical protein